MKAHPAKIGIFLLFTIVVLLSVANVFAIARKPITYNYYGKKLTESDIMDIYHQGRSLSCVQEIDDYAINNYYTDLFTCFDTEAEVDKYVSDNKARIDAAKEQARIKQEQDIANGTLKVPPGSIMIGGSHPMISGSLSNGVYPLTSCAHWAYNSQSFFTGTWLFDLCNGQTNANHSSVWSIWKDGSPNDTRLFCQTNSGGFNFQFNTTNYTIAVCPISGGGALSSKVY